MSEFWPTLLATIVGAAFAGAVTWLIFARQSHQVYVTRLDEALVGIVLAIPARVQQLDDYQTYLDDLEAGAGTDAQYQEALPPGPYDLGVRLEAARMVARGEDAKTLGEVASAFYATSSLPPKAQRARLSHLPELMRKWRHGELGKQPWSTFTRFAFDADKRAGLTPPPPWDPVNRIVTKLPDLKDPGTTE
ncbi:hypothetical protein [Microbacterium sp. W4I20]|uniref:hypothetical protein n=1 Tax=Microbacterium sp. W4I20 TaxID=3042262 RepID=UPI002782528F|nr:hypothetical protein [Microbacterium sp. W4I20]MDQ0729092.1 hypothetical protein [Microbacterium sp. W4I20]